MEPFSRRGSFKQFVYRSLRIPRKKKNVRDILEEEPKVFMIHPVSMENLVIHHGRRKATMPKDECSMIFGKEKDIVPCACNLVQFFKCEGKSYDKNCPLTSFERKRRSHEHFLTGHHANEQLFCPEQASQIELHFMSTATSEVVIRILSPNGESSGLIRPNRNEYVEYNPSKVGCGHGDWHIDVAVRDGPRFRQTQRKTINLSGQGMIRFHIDHDYKLRQVDRLWLGFH